MSDVELDPRDADKLPKVPNLHVVHCFFNLVISKQNEKPIPYHFDF